MQSETYQVFTSSGVYCTRGMGLPLNGGRTLDCCRWAGILLSWHLLLEVVGYRRELFAALAVNGVLESRMVGIQRRAVHQNVLGLVEVGNLSRKPNHVPEV